VSKDGSIAQAAATSEEDLVFAYRPVTIETFEKGIKTWHLDPSSTDRFIFENTDLETYSQAMTRALRAVLSLL